jgi:predicted membrane channel-forming protein YqfA (hemolysin III family)
MNRKSTHSVGAMHPIIFFVIIYGISLFLAFFVCSTVYYTFNEKDASEMHETVAQQKFDLQGSATASAFR